MAYLTQGASARPHIHENPHLYPQQTAIALIGAALIAYRVNGRPDQRAELRGLVKMAAALGTVDASERDALLSELEGDDAGRCGHG